MGKWKCSCGTENDFEFCVNCGKQHSDLLNELYDEWICVCGERNAGVYCKVCGRREDEGKKIEYNYEEPLLKFPEPDMTDRSAEDGSPTPPVNAGISFIPEIEQIEAEKESAGQEMDPLEIELLENVSSLIESEGLVESDSESEPEQQESPPKRKNWLERRLVILGLKALGIGALIGAVGVFIYLLFLG